MVSHSREGNRHSAIRLTQLSILLNDAKLAGHQEANNQAAGSSSETVCKRPARHQSSTSSLRLLVSLLTVTWLLHCTNHVDNRSFVQASALSSAASSSPIPPSSKRPGSQQTVGHNHHEHRESSSASERSASSGNNNDAEPPVHDDDSGGSSSSSPVVALNDETTTQATAHEPTTSSRSHHQAAKSGAAATNLDDSSEPDDELAPDESSSTGIQQGSTSSPTTAALASASDSDDYSSTITGGSAAAGLLESSSEGPVEVANDGDDNGDDETTEGVEVTGGSLGAGADDDQTLAEQQDNASKKQLATTTEEPDYGNAIPLRLRNDNQQQRHLRPSRQSSAPSAQAGASGARATSAAPTTLATTQATTGSRSNTTPMLELDMGADRLIIKPAPGDHEPVAVTTTSSTGAHESATESSDSELLLGGSGAISGRSGNHIAQPGMINERRQDLMYPSASVVSLGGGGVSGEDNEEPVSANRRPLIEEQTHHQKVDHQVDGASQPSSEQQDNLNTGQQQQLAIASNSVCYTQFAILIIVLTTILVTLALGFCVHFSLKHLSRHQFDLVANSKQFNGKLGYSMGAAPDESGGRRNLAFAGSTVSISESPFEFGGPNQLAARQSSGRRRQDQQQHLTGKANGCLLHLFQRDPGCNKCNSLPAIGRQFSDHELALEPNSCAFKNPYFTGADDEQQQQQQQYLVRHNYHQQQQFSSAPTRPGPASANSASDQQQPLATPDGGQLYKLETNYKSNRNGPPPAAVGLLQTAPRPLASEPASGGTSCLHSIENHIANLHNRQVTSSVQELAISGGQLAPAINHSLAEYQAPQIVDLTSEKQRAKILANPKEGDLIAVDISGHDIIGLGFDVCGNRRDGILIKSVSAHGPAQASGCIQPGDRIKCLNINFEDVTLQDAVDILNCGSPYKMRLLIEKRVVASHLVGAKSASKLSLGADHGHHHQQVQLDKIVGQQSAPKQHLRPVSLEGSSLLAGGQFVDATRGYLRRLTSKLGLAQQLDSDAKPFESSAGRPKCKLLSGGDLFVQQQSRFHDPYADNWRQQATVNTASNRQHLEQFLGGGSGSLTGSQMPLGSAMARQVAQSSRGIMVPEMVAAATHDDAEEEEGELDETIGETYNAARNHKLARAANELADEHLERFEMKNSASSADVLLAEQLQHRQRHNRPLAVQNSSISDLDLAEQANQRLRNNNNNNNQLRHKLHGPQLRADACGEQMIDLSQVEALEDRAEACDHDDGQRATGNTGRSPRLDDHQRRQTTTGDPMRPSGFPQDRAHLVKSHEHLEARQTIGQQQQQQLQHLETSQSQPEIPMANGGPTDLIIEGQRLAQVSGNNRVATSRWPLDDAGQRDQVGAGEPIPMGARQMSAISKSEGHLDQDAAA